MNTLGISLEIINFASVKSIKALADRESHEQFSDKMKYDESIKVYRDQLVMMEFERQQGKAEGLAEGLAEGEAKERLKNARGMKAAGIAPDLIAQITGFPSKQLRGCKLVVSNCL